MTRSRTAVRLAVLALALAALARAALPSGAAGTAFAAGPAPPSAGDGGTLASYRRALAAVERAVGALGGEAGAGGLDAVAFTLDLTALAPYQSPTPEPPYLELPVILAVDAAPGERWARVETTTRFPEVEFHTVRVLGPEGAADVDPATGQATAAAFAWADLERDFRRAPQLVVRDAWERRSELRWLGTATVDGAPAELVAFPFLGRRQLTLAIDGEGRLLRHEFLIDDLRTGDAVVAARFLDYRRAGGRWVPRRFEQWEAGVAAVTGTYTRLEVVGEPEAATFAVAATPPGGGAAGPGAVPAAARALAAGVVELAPGVHLVRRLEGQDYNSLVVDLGSAFAIVEAPLGAAAAEEILAAARTIDPGKPIRYVVATHFHDDHSGGVPHLVAATGATVVTTPGNADFFRAVTAAPRTLDGPPTAPAGPAELLLVEGGVLELPGDRPLRILDVGPTGHAREMLVAWLPEADLLFQGDLIRFPEEGPLEPAREAARRLAQYLAERGLEPARIASVHGRVGTPAELGEALAAGAD